MDLGHAAFCVKTPRLRLEAPSLDEARALMRGERAALEARIGAAIPADWPHPDLMAGLPEITAEMAGVADDTRFLWVIIEEASARVIGDVGFHGVLRDGAAAEIGYQLEPDARGHGYATEAAAALIAWTFAQTGVSEVTARIEPSNARSLRVAAKLGMQPRPATSPGYLTFGTARPPT
ncbi:MAG TPA: GNAT family N-acetyltransferase [Ktedonobacterales bacterium]